MERTIEVEFLSKPSTDAELDCHMVFDIESDLGLYGMDLIICYLRNGTLLDDGNEAYRNRIQATRYWLSQYQKLYRRSFLGPYLRCVYPKKSAGGLI